MAHQKSTSADSFSRRLRNYCVRCGHSWYTRAKTGLPPCPNCNNSDTSVGSEEEIAKALESRWLADAGQVLTSHQMYDYVANGAKRKPSDRKWLLLSCALCRRLWHHITDKRWRRAVEVKEETADGLLRWEDWSPFQEEFYASLEGMPPLPGGPANWSASLMAPHAVSILMADSPMVSSSSLIVRLICVRMNEGKRDEEENCHRNLFHDIFGNPFRPVAFDPAWRTFNVTAMARTIYDERRFSDMPILADALEEAGCTAQEILDHCRNPGEHVRGCWVVDLVLGKE